MIAPLRIMLLIVALMIAALLAGCGTPPPARTITVRVPVPVKCAAEKPERPVMPTESPRLRELPKDKLLDSFVQAATAEIELREGYEAKLVAALDSCL